MKLAPRYSAILLSAFLLVTLVSASLAQVPSQLRYGLPPPYGAGQQGAQLGGSVAVDGPYTVAGAIRDDTGAGDAGVVKIFDTVSGALLYILADPTPAVAENFGKSVAISGTRVVVGAPKAGTIARPGSVYVYDLASATPTIPIFSIDNPNPTDGDSFGWAVALSGNHLAAGTPLADPGTIVDAGTVYLYDLAGPAPTVPTATLNAPGTSRDNRFGTSIAFSGTRLVIGAPGIAYGGTTGAYAGRAFVYDLAGGTPATPVVTLNNPVQIGTYGQFGVAVALDGPLVVVGAYQDDTVDFNAGSAYVYDLTSATPDVPVFSLYNPGSEYEGGFGHSVALLGTRLLVGASNDNTGVFGPGSVYLFELAGPAPTEPILTVRNPNPTPHFPGSFGIPIAISSTRLAVGSPLDSTVAPFAGSVYLYDPASATPTVAVKVLSHPGPSVEDGFGSTSAMSGTLAIVGAPFNYIGTENAGSAYVFDLAGPTPTTPIIALNNPTPVNGGSFGNAVAISGTRVVVGDFFDATGGPFAGTAFAYDLAGPEPTTPLTLNNPVPTEQGNFGYSVAASGAYAVVGSPRNWDGVSLGGCAYVYDLAGATPAVPVFTLHKPVSTNEALFGISTAISGSLIVVGASGDDTGATDAGIAYVYDVASATPTVPIFTLNNPTPSTSEGFGSRTAISGNYVVISAIGDDTGATDAGIAYVYDLTGSNPSIPAFTLNNPDPIAQDHFGGKVAIDGTRVVVTANHGYDTPIVYIYDLASPTPTLPVSTLHPRPVVFDGMGGSVAISGTTVAIGIADDSTVALDKGYVYIYGPNPNDQDNNGLLDSWEIAHFGNATGHTAIGDDENDGLTNLLEEAFDTDPLTSSPAASPAIVNEGGYLTVTIAKHPGVTYEVQSAATPSTAAFSPTTTTVLVNDTTTLKARDNFPIASNPNRFLRVKVIATP